MSRFLACPGFSGEILTNYSILHFNLDFRKDNAKRSEYFLVYRLGVEPK